VLTYFLSSILLPERFSAKPHPDHASADYTFGALFSETLLSLVFYNTKVKNSMVLKRMQAIF